MKFRFATPSATSSLNGRMVLHRTCQKVISLLTAHIPYASVRMRQLAFSYNDLRINPKPYLEDGAYIGEIFCPKDIRKILENSGFFVPQQVNAWRTYIVVPPGVNAFDFIIVCAARDGLTLLGLYIHGKVFAANEMSMEELNAQNKRNG